MHVFKPHPKQEEFIFKALDPSINFLFYGGSAGGGKTFAGMALLILLCKLFPGSKWVVVRKDYMKIKLTSIPSFFKVCPPNFLKQVVGNIAYMKNSSMIIFTGENFEKDRELTKFDGLEVNGFLLEEIQELQYKMFQKANLRSGRHIIPDLEKQPKKLVICTGNPSQNWSKTTFYDPFMKNELMPPFAFIQALTEDNPSLTKEYLESLETLDEITYEKFVKGNWDITDVDRPFMYSFNKKKHVAKLPEPTISLPLNLVFDFNVDPITCTAWQHSENRTKIRAHKEFRLNNSDIYQLCDTIIAYYGLDKYFIRISGDASGKNSSAMVQNNLNYYKIIQDKFKLPINRFFLPGANPSIKSNRVLCNSLFYRHNDILIDESMKYTIEDLLYVEVNELGEIDKNKNKHRSHLLDTVRYYFNTFHADFLKYSL